MPMFDIEDSKNVNLTGNKTTSEDFLKAKNVGNINAANNEAKSAMDAPKPGVFAWIMEHIAATFLTTVLAGLVLAWLTKKLWG